MATWKVGGLPSDSDADEEVDPSSELLPASSEDSSSESELIVNSLACCASELSPDP